MTAITNLYNSIMGLVLKALGDWFLPTFARFSFAAVLLMYFWNSAKTKLGDGIFGFLSPSDNAYIQMFPKTVEALGYDTSQLGAFHWLVAVGGTVAEFILPALIIIGLFTRLAAGKDIGAWFDGPSNALILDQRLMWVVLFAILIVKGAGPLSVDRMLIKPIED
jgi:putative oxidoreductase